MQAKIIQEVNGSTIILKTDQLNRQNQQSFTQNTEEVNFEQSLYSIIIPKQNNHNSQDFKQISQSEITKYQEINEQLDSLEIDQIKEHFKELIIALHAQDNLIKRQEQQLKAFKEQIWCHDSIDGKYQNINLNSNINQIIQQQQEVIDSLKIIIQEKNTTLIEPSSSFDILSQKYQTALQQNQLLQQRMETQEQNYNLQQEIQQSLMNEKEQLINFLYKESHNKNQEIASLTQIKNDFQTKQNDLEEKLKQCKQFLQQSLITQCRLVQQQEAYEKLKKQNNKIIQFLSFIIKYKKANQRKNKQLQESQEKLYEQNGIIENQKTLIIDQEEKLSSLQQIQQQFLNRIVTQENKVVSQSEQIDTLMDEKKQLQIQLKKFENLIKGEIPMIFKNLITLFYQQIILVKSIDKFLTHQYVHDMYEYANEFNQMLQKSNSPFKFQIYILGK